LPACSAARSAAVGWEAARPCSSKEAKPSKIDSLIEIEKIFCARLLKNVSIFAGFVRRQAASRWAGCRAAGAALVGVLLVVGSDFIQERQPFRTRQGMRLAASPLGAPICEDLPVIFERNRNLPLPQKGVHHCEAMINEIHGRLFVSPSATSKAIIFSPKAI
jgi:hypothetical protein